MWNSRAIARYQSTIEEGVKRKENKQTSCTKCVEWDGRCRCAQMTFRTLKYTFSMEIWFVWRILRWIMTMDNQHDSRSHPKQFAIHNLYADVGAIRIFIHACASHTKSECACWLIFKSCRRCIPGSWCTYTRTRISMRVWLCLCERLFVFQFYYLCHHESLDVMRSIFILWFSLCAFVCVCIFTQSSADHSYESPLSYVLLVSKCLSINT